MQKRLVFSTAALLLSACASDLAIEHEYQEAKSQARMPMQQDGQQRPYQDLYPVPEAKDLYSDQVLYRLPLPTPALTQQREKITLNSLDGQSWLTVQVAPSQLWPQLKHFVSQHGSLRSGQDDGRLGLMNVYQGAEHFQFVISQGFQPKSSELTIKHLPSANIVEPNVEALEAEALGAEQALVNTARAEKTTEKKVEQQALPKSEQLLQQVATFLADSVDQPAYSYAAQGISTAKKMWLEADAKGVKQMFLVVSKQRAMGSLRLGFASADFKVLNSDLAKGVIEVRYMPPVPEDEQPGFIKRMFGVKRKAFDSKIQYAGNIYQFYLTTLAPNKQQVTVARKAAQWPTQRQRTSELNAIMRLLEYSIQ